jgi:hypothetical protein
MSAPVSDRWFHVPEIGGAGSSCGAADLFVDPLYVAYQWSREGVPIPGAEEDTYAAPTSGTYTVTVTDPNGCEGTSPPAEVVVLPAPSPSITGPVPACTTALLATQQFSTYQWYRDGVAVPGANGQTYLAPAPAGYRVDVTNDVGCPGASQVFFVGGTPLPEITGSASNLCPETAVVLTASPGYVRYQWAFNGSPIAGATQRTYAATLSGSYTVRAWDAGDCSGVSGGKTVAIGFCTATEVSPAGAPFPARLVEDPASPTGFYLYFQKVSGASGYNLYEGSLGTWYSHASAAGNLCNAAVTDLGTGEMRTQMSPSPGNHYYLVTAYRTLREGPSGFDSGGAQIPTSQSTCSP